MRARRSWTSRRQGWVNLASQMGYAIGPSDVLSEVASGVSLDRPRLNQVRLMVGTGQFDALFVYGPHRLSRDPVDLLMLLQEFASHGVAVHFVQGASADAPQADLIYGVRRYAADLERSKHRKRTVRGMEAVARSGRMPTGSHVQPFGYRLEAATMKRVFDEAESEVVVRVFGLYAAGLSMAKIAKKLNTEGVKTRTGQALDPYGHLPDVVEPMLHGAGLLRENTKRWRRKARCKTEGGVDRDTGVHACADFGGFVPKSATALGGGLVGQPK